MVLGRYLEYINSSTVSAEDIAELFGKPVRLANLLLRPYVGSPVPCHAEMIRCLVEAYPSINDVEGSSFGNKHSVGTTQRTSSRYDYRSYIKRGESNPGSHRGFDRTGYGVELCYEACLWLVSSWPYVFRPQAYQFLAISSMTNEALGDNGPAVERTRRLLMFLTILWQGGALGTFHPQMVSSFVSSLGKKVAARDPSVVTLGRDVLNALTALETLVPGSLGKDKGFDCADVWLASLDSDPENLLDACMYFPGDDCFTNPFRSRAAAFANYVVVTSSSRKRDALLESETWDYLRDSLLLIFTRHYFCDEEPIALAVAPSVCFAMTCLFRTAGPPGSANIPAHSFRWWNSDFSSLQDRTCWPLPGR